MDPTTLASALWGLAGAFIYAAPNLSTCLFTRKAGDGFGAIGRCVLDFAVALVIGALASAAFAQWAQAFLKRTGPEELRAIAAVIGLLANPAAPRLTARLSSWLIKKAPGS